MPTESRVIVLASRNRDKLRELREICEGSPFQVTSSEDWPGLPEVIEDGTTTWGNATRKALITAAYTGEIAVADDTAFQIRTLGGLPDVFAAAYGVTGGADDDPDGDGLDNRVELLVGRDVAVIAGLRGTGREHDQCKDGKRPSDPARPSSHARPLEMPAPAFYPAYRMRPAGSRMERPRR